jgi:hypothetical protein
VSVDAPVSAAEPEAVAASRPPESDEPPAWLRLIAFAGAAGVLTFGATGLVLAINGWYRPAVAFPLGAVAFVGVMVLGRPAFASPGSRNRAAHVAAATGLVCILAITAWNASNASQHVLINRDGGSYLNTGRWLARDGALEVEPNVGPFQGEKTVVFHSYAVYPRKNGTLQFQFAHLLPVVLAEAYAIGGDAGLTHAPPLLGGIALLAFFVLAWRLMRNPWFALAAMLALAFIIPQVWFTRDAYSEVPSQILIFTALWLLSSRRVVPPWRVALTSGLFLGALWAVRIDAIVFLIGVPLFMMIAWLRADPDARATRIRPSILAFGAGLVPGLLLGFIDLSRHSGGYWSDLSGEEYALMAVVALSAIGATVIALCWRFVAPLARRLPWNTIAWGVAAFVIVLGFAAWAFRPKLQTVHGDGTPITGFQVAEGQTVDRSRNYYEWSLTWMSWYLGGLTLGAAIVGAGLLARQFLLGKRMRWLAPLCIIAPGSLLYLYAASAVPDQVWVMRRFLVSSFQTLILIGVGFAAYLFARKAAWLRVVGAIVAIVAVAYPLYTVWDVRDMTEKRGFLDVIYDVCDEVGPDAAIVVVEKDLEDLTENWVPQALRGWCGSTVAVSADGWSTPASVQNLANKWNAAGKKFFLVAAEPQVITDLAADAKPVPTRPGFNPKMLERKLTHRPKAYANDAFSMVVAEIPPQ